MRSKSCSTLLERAGLTEDRHMSTLALVFEIKGRRTVRSPEVCSCSAQVSLDFSSHQPRPRSPGIANGMEAYQRFSERKKEKEQFHSPCFIGVSPRSSSVDNLSEVKQRMYDGRDAAGTQMALRTK